MTSTRAGDQRGHIADVDALFEALADPTRRRILQLLGEHPYRAGELAKATHLSAPAVSRHLRILLETGFVEDERVPDDGRLRVFRLRPEPLAAVRAWVDQQLIPFRRSRGRRSHRRPG